ncbi:MAG: ketoacyl-ACP synthase III [Prevotella sp.]|jgi:3-oxoacyl-[acyl-carrier-protein] synthase-3|nr:ketoacyl-ACP synthase III [Prevotella sp.]
MYINATGYYIPATGITNDHFTKVNGTSGDWTLQKAGIRSRSGSSEEETMNYMCAEAVKNALPKLSYNINEVDLIIFASCTPAGTIATAGHFIQREYNIPDAKVFHIYSDCSSAISAMEIIYSFFSSQIASKALLVCADRNSTYPDDADCISGPLRGNGAVACFFSGATCTGKDSLVIDITSRGLGHAGISPDFENAESQMPYGKDAFMHACNYISRNTKDIVENNGYSLDKLSYFVGHQANTEILKNVTERLGLRDDVILSDMEDSGDTGFAGALLVYARNTDKFQSGDLICLSVFGGGYSTGACLLKML